MTSVSDGQGTLKILHEFVRSNSGGVIVAESFDDVVKALEAHVVVTVNAFTTLSTCIKGKTLIASHRHCIRTRFKNKRIYEFGDIATPLIPK